MKKLIVLAGAFCLLAGTAIAGDLDKRAAESRAAVKEFFGALKGQLVSAIEAGGPVYAIEVCKQVAAVIAADISEKKGWRVARTSLKPRNPNNAPDAWEKAVLMKFEARKAAGENPKQMEFYQVVGDGDEKAFRYMKAIPTAEKPCLACHGAELKPEVLKALAKLYPQDQARGYKTGDIRGAFTITQPMK
jgi:hypothetical protein